MSYETPWAPSQHKGMSCCCHSPEANECYRLRYGVPMVIDYDDDSVFQNWDDEACDCCCHDRDWEDEDGGY